MGGGAALACNAARCSRHFKHCSSGIVQLIYVKPGRDLKMHFHAGLISHRLRSCNATKRREDAVARGRLKLR